MNAETCESDSAPLEKLVAVADQFNDESWRGRVLIASGLLEEMLKDLIAAHMTEEAAEKKLFEGERAPLGSFGGRTCVALSLGLITAEESRDLETIRKVRNKFAHQADASFERNDIREASMKMTLYRYTDEENGSHPAYRFMHSAVVLLTALPLRTHNAKVTRCKIRPDDQHWWE